MAYGRPIDSFILVITLSTILCVAANRVVSWLTKLVSASLDKASLMSIATMFAEKYNQLSLCSLGTVCAPHTHTRMRVKDGTVIFSINADTLDLELKAI